MYNPDIHHRRSVRLKNYDYSQNGAYFVTICTHNRECLFGKVVEGEMVVNEYGAIAGEEWLQLEMRFPNVKLDAFQIMPNHIHGIIRIVGAGLAPAVGATARATTRATARVAPTATADERAIVRAGLAPAPTVGDIIGAYKSLVYKRCLDLCKLNDVLLGKLWQRNYHEHIISNQNSYNGIAEYIANNPKIWEEDKLWIAR